MKKSLVLISVLMIAACSNKEAESDFEYGGANNDGGLQVPPTLSSPRYSPALKSTDFEGLILPQVEGMSMEREGRLRYVIVEDAADVVWNRLVNFMANQKLVISQASPELGVLRTEWMENSAKDKNYFLGKYFERFRSSSEKDRFSFWLEREANDKTRIYISHQGQIDTVKDIENTPKDAIVEFHWVPRPSEVSYEVEMLRRFMVFSGSDEGQSEDIAALNLEEQPPTRAALADEEGIISYNGNINYAWQILNHDFLSRGYSMISRSASDKSLVLLFDRGDIEQPSKLEQVILRKKAVRRDQIALVQLTEEDAVVKVAISSPEENSPLEESTRAQLINTILKTLNGD